VQLSAAEREAASASGWPGVCGRLKQRAREGPRKSCDVAYLDPPVAWAKPAGRRFTARWAPPSASRV